MRHLAFLLIALSGCTLYDTRRDVALVLVGPAAVDAAVTVRGNADASRLVLDGVELDLRLRAGVDTEVDVRHLSEGPHRLRARLYEGELIRESPPVVFTVDRTGPAVTSVQPPTGGVYQAVGPFTVTVDLAEPVDPASATGDRIQLRRGQEAVAASLLLSDDRRRITVAAPSSLRELGPVTLFAEVRDPAGNPSCRSQPCIVGSWSHVPFLVVAWDPAPGSAVSGEVAFRVQWEPANVTSLPARIDGVAIGSFVQGVPLAWNSGGLPDGPHLLEVLLDGAVAASLPFLVHNQPPRLVSCTPRFVAPDDASTDDGVEVRFSRPVCFQAGDICAAATWPHGADLRPIADAGLGSSYASTFLFRPAGRPGAYTIDLSSARDERGRPLAGDTSCSVTFPAWRRPWGEGPVAGVGSGAAGIGLGWVVHRAEGGLLGSLLRIAPPSATLPGAVERLEAIEPSAWAVVAPPLNGAPFLPASHLRATGPFALWLEEETGGPTRVRVARDLTSPPETVTVVAAASGPVELVRPDTRVAGWIEADPAGVRKLVLASGSLGGPWVVTEPANVDPLGDASQAAVDDSSPVRVAYVEHLPGGVGQLRVRQLPLNDTTGWVSLGGALNRDPLAPASEPSIGGTGGSSRPTVAWVEDGQVLARQLGDGGAWTEPATLNADPSAPARSPRVVMARGKARVVFVERGTDGDRIEVREDRPGLGWHPLEPVLAGEVVSLETTQWPTAVLWTEPAGTVRLRVHND